jgi:hypothetical protein
MFKEYLGDGVYVDLHRDGTMVLTAEDGIVTTNIIYLDDFMWHNLMSWKVGVYKGLKEIKGTGDKDE